MSEGGYAILRSGHLQDPLAASLDLRGVLRDGVNRVGAECIGAASGEPARLALTVNGTTVLEVEDPTGIESFDSVGLSVYSVGDAAEAEFDNLKVSTP
jgi:hypothetical protein